MTAHWWVSSHAARQWVARFRPELTLIEARCDLAALARDCIEVDRLRADGRREYLHPAWPLARFLVGKPHVEGYLPTLVTVLDALGSSQNTRSRKGVPRHHRRFRHGGFRDE